MPHVELRSLRKNYGAHRALNDVSLQVERGAFFTLLGPSGCGKTTLLRAIAGFHRQDAGEILLEGRSIGHLGADQRQVGMVFQDYAVFPHLSVFDNVAFGLVQRKRPAAEIRERVGAVLETVQLAGQATRMPHQLSGGQQQRVGLARALVVQPQVLLMDEPLSNLDAKLRVDLRRDIRALQQSLGITTLYVTHDQEEALSLSDQVCVMHDGVVQQVDTPWAVYHRPANRFVAGFVGSNNFVPASVAADGVQLLGQRLPLEPGRLQALAQASASEGLVAAVRPEKLRIVTMDRPLDGPGLQLPATLRQAMFAGRELWLTVEVDGHGLLEAWAAPLEAVMERRPGDAVTLGVAAGDLQFFAPGETGARLA